MDDVPTLDLWPAGALPDSGEVYREIIERSSDAVALLDPQGCYLEQNGAHRGLIGYTDSELTGQTPAIHLGERTFHHVLRELQRTGRFRGEVTTRTKSDRVLTIDLTAFAVLGRDGKPVCFVGIKRDITHRKQTELELEHRYRQLQTLYRITEAVGRADKLEAIYDEALRGLEEAIGAARAAVLLFDPDGVMRFKAWRGISSHYRGLVEGHTPWQPDTNNPTPITVPDVARDASLGPVREAILAEGIRAVGFFPLVSQGTLLGKFMVYYDAPYAFAAEEVQLAQSIASHVAFAIARTRDEQERRFQQALLAAEMEASLDGILVVSQDGKILSSNRRFAEIWEIPDEVMARRSDQAALDAVRDALESPDEFLARVEYLYAHPDQSSREEVRLMDGRTIDRYSTPIASADWGYHGRVWFFRDVTERKRAEEAQRFLTEATSILGASLDVETTLRSIARLTTPLLADFCVIDIVDEDGTLRRVATAHVDPARQELTARLKRFPPRLSAHDHPVVRAIRAGEPQLQARVTVGELRRIAVDADHLAALRELAPRTALVVPLIARERKLGAITLALAESGRTYSPDEQRLAEELARRAALAVDNARLYQTAMAANRAKSDFLAVMSHELRTPLNAILGYTDLLLMGVPSPLSSSSLEQVERIRASAQHLLQIIEQILTFSRLDAGRAELNLQSVELEPLVRETAALIQPLAARKGLLFELQLDRSPLQVTTDPGKLRQILLNLLSNAIKFTENGTVRLRLEVLDDEVQIRVTDTGIGIPGPQLEKIFEPFWQVDHTSTRQAGGTGLGLSVTRQLAELLGGSVDVESIPQAGSSFTVRLPLHSSGWGTAPFPPPRPVDA